MLLFFQRVSRVHAQAEILAKSPGVTMRLIVRRLKFFFNFLEVIIVFLIGSMLAVQVTFENKFSNSQLLMVSLPKKGI